MLRPLPTLNPPLHRPAPFGRHLSPAAAFGWLAAGWREFRAAPGPSLAYGVLLFAISVLVFAVLYAAGMLYLVLPATAGFLIVGPFLALGLYAQARAQMEGRTLSLGEMIHAGRGTASQLAYAGLMLGLLILFWIRAADLLYALFFGIVPFPGAEEAFLNVLHTPRGWALIGVGTAVGGLFAAFAFAISLFAMPMILAEGRDALTAMGLSFAMTVQNLPATLTWAVIVTIGLALSAATGLLLLIIVFPVLGYGTWHAWCAIGAPGRVE